MIFSPSPDLECEVLNGLLQYDGKSTKFCFDAPSFMSLIHNFDLIVTTVGHKTPAMVDVNRQIIDIARSQGIPLVDVPHGLFQIGHNFYDDSILINLASSANGMGIWNESFCDFKISWFDGATDYPCPGYPRHNKNILPRSYCVPDYTLLTTNTNWYLYGPESRRLLLNFIESYALANPSELILWSPHPAENHVHSPEIYFYSQYLLPENVFVYGGTTGLSFAGVECTEDLIAGCSKGITTVSTCLIDYEANNKLVVVLATDSTVRLAASLARASIYHLAEDIGSTPEFGELLTGYLKPFDLGFFDNILSAMASA